MNKLDIVNKTLSENRIGSVSTLNDGVLSTYPYNCIDSLTNESVHSFSNSQVWSYAETLTDLEFFSGFETYYLSDFDIDFNRVKEVFYFDGTEKKDLVRIPYPQFICMYKNCQVYDKPQFFSISNDVIHFYPKIAADYSLKILHTAHIPVLITESDSVQFVPASSQQSLADYVIAVISMILAKANSTELFNKYLMNTGKAKKANQTYFNKRNLIPSKIRWE